VFEGECSFWRHAHGFVSGSTAAVASSPLTFQLLFSDYVSQIIFQSVGIRLE
jgi:hypothetical protein